MSVDATAQGTIYYDTYVGNTVPVAGTSLTIGSDEISLILDATNQTSAHLYDVFAINVSGTLTLCAGPAWTNSTTRSQTIALSGGVWTNSGSMTHCYNNAVDKGAISSHAGTYLGTFETTANAQTGMQFHAAAANGGSAAVMDLYNAYNQVRFTSTSQDNTTSWTYGTQTWRSANNSTSNRVTFVDGLGQTSYFGSYQLLLAVPTSGAAGSFAMDLNSTSATPTTVTTNETVNPVADIPVLTNTNSWGAVLGLNYVQAMEYSSATTTYYGAPANTGGQLMSMVVSVFM